MMSRLLKKAHLRRWCAWALVAAYRKYALTRLWRVPRPSRAALHLGPFEQPGRQTPAANPRLGRRPWALLRTPGRSRRARGRAWWLACLSVLCLPVLAAAAGAAGAPAPVITELTIRAEKMGDAPQTLVVRGRGFQPDSVVHINGQPAATRFRSAEELDAAITFRLFDSPGDLPVIVVPPDGAGGPSNVGILEIPASPPVPGRFVVFTSDRRGGRNHIYLLDRKFGRLDPLEEANSYQASDEYPSISADGRFIVFQSNRRHGQFDVFLFDRETRQLDPLPELNDPNAFNGFPSLSADGRFIVFESDRGNGKPKVFLFDRQTRSLSELRQANEPAADNGLAAVSN